MIEHLPIGFPRAEAPQAPLRRIFGAPQIGRLQALAPILSNFEFTRVPFKFSSLIYHPEPPLSSLSSRSQQKFHSYCHFHLKALPHFKRRPGLGIAAVMSQSKDYV